MKLLSRFNFDRVDIKSVKKGTKLTTLKHFGTVTRVLQDGCYIDIGDEHELREEWVDVEDIIKLEE